MHSGTDRSSTVSAILLAAGSSRRMGSRNKLLLPVKGKPLVRHMLDTLLASRVNEIIVVTGFEEGRVREVLPDSDITVIHNPRHLSGMTSTIQQGVLACSSNTSAYLICLSDTPFILLQDIHLILDTYQKALNKFAHPIVIPRYKKKAGHPKLFSSHYRDQILNHKGSEGLKNLILEHSNSVVYTEIDSNRIYTDIDTPEMYNRYSDLGRP